MCNLTEWDGPPPMARSTAPADTTFRGVFSPSQDITPSRSEHPPCHRCLSSVGCKDRVSLLMQRPGTPWRPRLGIARYLQCSPVSPWKCSLNSAITWVHYAAWDQEAGSDHCSCGAIAASTGIDQVWKIYTYINPSWMQKKTKTKQYLNFSFKSLKPKTTSSILTPWKWRIQLLEVVYVNLPKTN